MEVKQQTKLDFKDVYITNLDYKLIGVANKNGDDIKLSVKPKLNIIDNHGRFDIAFLIALKVEEFFEITFQAVGIFQLSEEALKDEKLVHRLMHHNSPAIVFPYIRSFVSNFTSSLGLMQPIKLPTQFFHGDLESIQPKEEE